jgi:ribosomal protein RSM22 (predicted rRNA methylase)
MPFDPPPPLTAALARETGDHARIDLRAAAETLSNTYRAGHSIPENLTPPARAAYLAVRFPATYAIAARVWEQVLARHPVSGIHTVLDAGAGPGTASLALGATLGALRATLLERDVGWRAPALRLAAATGIAAEFVPGNLALLGGVARHDAVVASHVLNELAVDARTRVVGALWAAAGEMLVLIEPGTPSGFASIRAARDLILSRGGHVVAPCTHGLGCPVQGQDWCHFEVQIERTALHRAVKSGSLSHESGKFSYVALARTALPAEAGGRIVRRPIRASGHAHFDLCREGRIERVTVSRKQGEAYRRARDAAWGDLLES